MPNQESISSRSGRSKTSKSNNLQSKLPVPATINNVFEVSGHSCIEIPAPQRFLKTSKSFRLPILNHATSSYIPQFFRPTEVRSPILTCCTEWKVPTYNESMKTDSNSQPSFIRSVSTSESESWSDDLENEMTAQLMASMTRLDDMFYSSLPITSNRELFQEIKLWQNRFPFLRISGKKAKIYSDNKMASSEDTLDQEEMIINDGKFIDDDCNHWAKITSDTTDRKNDSTLKKQIRNSVISHLTNHFINAMKNEVEQKLADDYKIQPKKFSKTMSIRKDEALDINDNRLKVSEDLEDILNISPISLKVAAPKSSYLSSLSTKRKENTSGKTKTNVSQSSTHLRMEHRISTKLVHTVHQSPRSTTDNVRIDFVFHPNKSSLTTRKAFELNSRKPNSKKPTKNDKLLTSNPSRFRTLPPLKTTALRPTSAIYNNYNKLPSESRPTSSLILAPSLLKDETFKTDKS